MLALDDVAQVVAASPAEIDGQFRTALRLIDIGQAAVAIPLLENLYRQTKAIRIRLELARALWFAGRSSDSRALFVEIYKSDPPPAVKVTILKFIDQIDRKQGKFSFGVSATKASNPLSQPAEVQLYFLGSPFTLQLDQQDTNLLGVIFSANYERAFAQGYDVRASISFREMPKHPNANMLVGDISVGKQFVGKPLEVRLGTQFEQMANRSYRLPYVEVGYRKVIANKLDIQPRLQVGYFKFLAGSGLSGMNYQLSAPFTYTLNPAMALSIGPKLEFRDASFAEQRYINAGVDFEAALNFKQFTVATTVYPYRTQFWGTDPFWGQKRSDKALYLGAVVSSDRVRVKGFLPTLNPFCSLNGSNIAYYRVNNCGFNFGARKIF